MKNLLYTFKIENKKGSIIFTTTTCDEETALFIASTLLFEGYFPIKSPAYIRYMGATDYDC